MPIPTPARSSADRNLLFGVLAVQMDFVSRDALLKAMNAWVMEKGKPLGQILVEQGALLEDARALLEALVRKHLELHGGDPEKSLAAVSSLEWVRAGLQQIADPEVQASLADWATLPPTRDKAKAGRVPSTGPADDPYATRPPSSAEPAGTGLRYRILRPHARGGLGEVFVAEDQELHREVALKEIQGQHADHPESRSRFLLEAEITGGLEHPGIVPVYGLGTYADGRPYYAMRFIKGDSLQDAVRRFHQADVPGRDSGERALALRQLLRRFIDVCNAIAYAHSRGVLHRDLKPGNIMLGKYGETLVVDWGLAKPLGHREEQSATGEHTLMPPSASGSAVTQMGSALGTPAYMSPEQAAGRLDELGPPADVYSLGATLYCLLTGQAPFTDANVGLVLANVQMGEFPPPRQVKPDVPAPLEAICLKAMALKPRDRYDSPRALADEIEHWLADEPVTAHCEPLFARLGRWGRRHRLVVTGAAALLTTAAVALGISTVIVGHERQQAVNALEKEERARRDRAQAQVDALLTATPQAVPQILKGLESFQEDVLPRLREIWAEDDRPDNRLRRLRAGLALLTVDSAVKDRIADWMLEVSDPPELLLVRDTLRPHAAELKWKLWARLEGSGEQTEVRFRAACALAAYDSDDPRWEEQGRAVAARLVRENPLVLARWLEAFRPVNDRLLAPLGEVFRDGNRPEAERRLAMALLADYAADQPEVLAALLLDAADWQFLELVPKLQPYSERATVVLRAALSPVVGFVRTDTPVHPTCSGAGGAGTWLTPGVAELVKEAEARRQARAAVALLRLDQADAVWPLFRHRPDPEVRSQLLAKLAPLRVDAGLFVRRLENGAETEVTARRALILALGEYGPEQLPAEVRAPLVAQLLCWYREDRDPGMHGAIDWLLRPSREGPAARPLDWGQAEELARIDAELAVRRRLPQLGALLANGPLGPLVSLHLPVRGPAGAGWYLTGDGQTFVVLSEAKQTFSMGSPPWEAGHSGSNELQHQRRVGRSLAIATKPVTVRQYQDFVQEHPEFRFNYTKQYSPEQETPIISVDWYSAAAYCRWLSEREGVPEDQMCYPSIEDIAKASKNLLQRKLKLPRDYLSRSGYRLPSEAEWELACRAEAVTSRYYGSSLELLGRYAWYFDNSKDRTWPVGQKRPNDLGLFDMQGNVWQWCQESGWLYEPGMDGKPAEDEADTRDITDRLSRVLRGGSFNNRASIVRSAYRGDNVPASPFTLYGFRPARTFTP